MSVRIAAALMLAGCAASDPRVVGLVLVDANLPDFFDDAEVARIMTMRAPDLDAMERAKPGLARALRAMPATARRLREAPVPPRLPIIDIGAERPAPPPPEEQAAWRRVHAEFVAASPAREAVTATGSAHFVMRDRRQVVVDAVARLLRRLRGQRR